MIQELFSMGLYLLLTYFRQLRLLQKQRKKKNTSVFIVVKFIFHIKLSSHPHSNSYDQWPLSFSLQAYEIPLSGFHTYLKKKKKRRLLADTSPMVKVLNVQIGRFSVQQQKTREFYTCCILLCGQQHLLCMCSVYPQMLGKIH